MNPFYCTSARSPQPVACRQKPALRREPDYGTIAIGACQNAALRLAGSMTVTWQP